jgi:16S rRNA processing protein RimM
LKKIGKIVSTHGLKGEVVLAHNVIASTNFKQWDCLMIELAPKSFIPFFIENIEATQEGECLCKLEEINSKEEAKSVLHKAVYNSINYDVKLMAQNEWADLIGYEMYADNKRVGVIEDILQVSMNMMFQVNSDHKEILIPAPEEFIESIDTKAKIIYMKLPDGLLDL